MNGWRVEALLRRAARHAEQRTAKSEPFDIEQGLSRLIDVAGRVPASEARLIGDRLEPSRHSLHADGGHLIESRPHLRVVELLPVHRLAARCVRASGNPLANQLVLHLSALLDR